MSVTVHASVTVVGVVLSTVTFPMRFGPGPAASAFRQGRVRQSLIMCQHTPPDALARLRGHVLTMQSFTTVADQIPVARHWRLGAPLAPKV